MPATDDLNPMGTRERGLASIWWLLLTEALCGLVGVTVGLFVYLPGPLVGWLIFSMLVLGTGGLLLGMPVGLAVLAIRSMRS